MRRLVFIVFALLFLALSLWGNSEKVTLLLKWHHQFQFAGFYMAKEKGYYEDLGLDVSFETSIRDDNPTLLANSPATYAVLDPIAFIEQSKGVKIRALGAIFQQSPEVFLTLKSSGIKSPKDFVGKKVMGLSKEADSSLKAFLHEMGIKSTQLETSPKNPTVEALLSGEADIITAYLTDAPYRLEKQGYEYNIIDPLAYGIDFYGDMLFTSQDEVQNHPSRVKRFIAATQKGWKYALENIEESIDIIKHHYGSSLSKDTLHNEAKRIKELMMLDRIPFGMLNKRKVNSILGVYSEFGYIKTDREFVYDRFMNFGDPFGFWKLLSDGEKLFLQNHPRLRVGIRKQFMPFFEEDKEGNYSGLLNELTGKLENILGIDLELVPLSLEGIKRGLEVKDVDIFFGTEVGFGKKYIFTQEFGTYRAAAYSLDKELKINGVEDLQYKKVSLIKGSDGERILSSFGNIEAFPKKDTFELINSVTVGESEVLIASLPVIQYYKEYFNQKNLHLNGVFYKRPLHLAMGMNRSLYPLQSIIDKAIGYIGQKELNALFDLWLSQGEYTRLDLTKEEVAFLNENPTVKVGSDKSWAPFEFSKKGKPQGYSVDFLKLLEKRTGLNFEIENSDTWTKTLKRFQRGELDMLSLIGFNKKREKYTLFSSAVLSSSLSLAYNKAKPMITLQALNEAGEKLGVGEGYWFIETIKKEYPKIKIVEYPKIEQGIIAVSKGEIAALLDVTTVLQYNINKNMVTDILTSPPVSLGDKTYERYHIGVHKTEPVLYSIIQKGIDSIDEADILQLQRRWFGDILEGSVSKQLLLSEKEKSFIKNHPLLRVGIDTSWSPYDFEDEEGKHQGIVSELTKYIFKDNLNLELKSITKPLWKEHIEAIDKKQIDVIAGISKSPERAKKMLFSEPYLKIPLIIVGREDETLIDSLGDLNGKRVGVVGGYLTDSILKKKYPDIKIVRFPNIRRGLIDLSRKKLDYFFDTLAAVNDIIKRNGLTNIKLLGQTNESFELSFGIRKDLPELQAAVNKMIRTMPNEYVERVLNKWIAITPTETVDYSLIWKLLLLFAFVISAIVYWNRKLSKEIERRRVVEKELEVQKIKAENANQAKSEFLSNMSHEIRTPMNAIIGFAELTSKMDLPQKALANIKTIQKSAKSLVAIINDILDLSKIEAGKLIIKKEACALQGLAEEMYAVFQIRAENKGIFFDISLGQDVPSTLIIDEVRVRQILINLIGNALKFTHKGSVKVSFHAKENSSGDSTVDLSIAVKDTGIGIAKKDQHKVFGVFEQQSSQDDRLYGGTGLGLAITRRLASLMGGEITLQSEENKGSVFTLTIPHVEVASSLSYAPKDMTVSIEFESAKILIVDDIEANLHLLEDILELYGFEVVKTDSGAEAIHLALEESPDLVLMDIKMPHVDGYEAARAIRNNPQSQNIPIVTVSASVIGEEKKIETEKAFDDFIPKPIDIGSLEKVLCKYIKYTTHQDEVLEVKEEEAVVYIKKEDKNSFVAKVKEALHNGDLNAGKEVLAYLEKEGKNSPLITKLQNAIANIDIEVFETQLQELIEKVEKGDIREF